MAPRLVAALLLLAWICGPASGVHLGVDQGEKGKKKGLQKKAEPHKQAAESYEARMQRLGRERREAQAGSEKAHARQLKAKQAKESTKAKDRVYAAKRQRGTPKQALDGGINGMDARATAKAVADSAKDAKRARARKSRTLRVGQEGRASAAALQRQTAAAVSKGAPWRRAKDEAEADTCWLTSRSNGPLAYQIHGMITAMALNGMKVPGKNSHFKFDATMPDFHFQFQKRNETDNATRIMANALKGFVRDFCGDCVAGEVKQGHYAKNFGMGSHYYLLGKIQNETCLERMTFMTDGASLGFADANSTAEFPAMLEKINQLRPLFLNTIRELPTKSLFSPEGRNVVIHMDDIRGEYLPEETGYFMGKRRIFHDRPEFLYRQLDLMRGILMPQKEWEESDERPADPRLTRAIELARGPLEGQLTGYAPNGEPRAPVNLIVETKRGKDAWSMLYKLGIKVAFVLGQESIDTLVAYSQMIHADVLITGHSKFPYSAALLREPNATTLLIPEDLPMREHVVLPPHALY